MKIGDYNFEVSNEDKVLFPVAGITKGDIIEYYLRIAEHMLPHLRDRPVAMERFPDGIQTDGFYQKEVPDYFPGWIDRASVDRKEGSPIEMVVINNKATLAYLANQGCIALHGVLAKKDKQEQPDKLIFDLDPPEGEFELVKQCALDLLEYLKENTDLSARVMTTGSKGLHVYIHLPQQKTFDEIRTFAKEIAEKLADRHPEQYTTDIRKNKRKGRLFIDYLRNSHGQHSIIPFSLRALEGAPVATPLKWEELSGLKSAQQYSLKNIFRRLGQMN